MRLTDEQIIEGLRVKDTDTLNYMYDQFKGLCQYIVVTNSGTNEDAEDIFQESLIIIINRVSRPEFNLTSKFQTFLFAIMDKLWKLELSKRRHADNYMLYQLKSASNTEDVKEEYDGKLVSSLLWTCFKKLGRNCQSILKLWWEGYSQKEIAEYLSYKYGYLRKKKMDCDESLICIIKENDDLMKIFREEPTLISEVKYA